MRVAVFWSSSFLKYRRGANFRMITKWCHVKSGLTTLMFDNFVAPGMKSMDQKTRLADKVGIKKDVPNPRLAKKVISRKIANSSTKQSLETNE